MAVLEFVIWEDSRSDQLRVLLWRDLATVLDDIADDIVLVDVAPQMDAHGFLAVEQRVRYATDLAEDDAGDGPGVGVLLQGADIEADGLLDDVVLAVGDEEGPVREVDHGGHDDDACEEGGVVEELPGEADEGRDVFGGCETFRCVDLARLGREQDLAGLHADVHALYPAEA